MSTSVLGVIPARYASSRFPGKVLAVIAGKSMLQRVWERCSMAGLQHLVIATDHTIVAEHAQSFGAEVVLTSTEHASGTDRCFEAMFLQNEAYDYVVNIQGDEPFIDPAQIKALIDVLDGKTEIATLIKQAETLQEVLSVDEAKVVLNDHGNAIYFSRSPIPYVRNQPQEEWLQYHTYYLHVGLYAYRADVLRAISKLPTSKLEFAESLEQLRWLEAGYAIRTVLTSAESICVDRPEDMARAEQYALRWGL
jgi:3-deoxy-manno-octulosonate cytidylyltransferase (CMP-KDO synthetase)